MRYQVKIKIAGVEVLQNNDADAFLTTPYITGVKVKSSTSLYGLDIGSVASDSVYFSMYNPFKQYFDGEKVELYILPEYDMEESKDTTISENVGDASATESTDLYENESDIDYIDDEEGEDITDAENAEIDSDMNSDASELYDKLEGETISDVETETDESEETWQKLGTYWVYNQTNSNDDSFIYFECYDGISRLSQRYYPTTPATLQDAYDEFAETVLDKFGITCDEYDFEPIDNTTEFDFSMPFTYRTFIGYLAGVTGGYATFGLDDTLGISSYSFSDHILLSDELIHFNDTSSGEITIDSITCNRSTSIFEEDLISTEDDEENNGDIKFNNPFVTEDILEDIYSDLHGISYRGASVKAMWSPGIESGSFLRVMDDDEYKNYLELRNAMADTSAMTESDIAQLKANIMSVGKTILVTNQTIDFSGDAITSIDSILPTVYKKESTDIPELFQATNIRADKLIVKDLAALGAEIAGWKLYQNEDGSRGLEGEDGTIFSYEGNNDGYEYVTRIQEGRVELFYNWDGEGTADQNNNSTLITGGMATFKGSDGYETQIVGGNVYCYNIGKILTPSTTLSSTSIPAGIDLRSRTGYITIPANGTYIIECQCGFTPEEDVANGCFQVRLTRGVPADENQIANHRQYANNTGSYYGAIHITTVNQFTKNQKVYAAVSSHSKCTASGFYLKATRLQ